MKPMLFSLFYDTDLPLRIASLLDAEHGDLTLRSFPDGESYLRLNSAVEGRRCIVIANLHQPDSRFLPLAFVCRLLRDSGAREIVLVAPYLPYMRQDKVFNPGEAVTSAYFAGLLGPLIDRLITVDPHLHRYPSLEAVYKVPGTLLHATPVMVDWIRDNVTQPLIIGPDSESEQWAAAVAEGVGCPVLVLEKTRLGDRDVRISVPRADAYRDRTPVLVDDIISTGRTLLETARQLQIAGLKPAVCVGVHAVFASKALQELRAGPIAEVVTCDSIPHATNRISLASLIAQALKE